MYFRITVRIYYFFLSPKACTHCRPSGKRFGLQACTPRVGGKKKKVQQLKREGGGMKGTGGLCKKLKNPALPPKWARSGVTYHYHNSVINLSLPFPAMISFCLFRLICLCEFARLVISCQIRNKLTEDRSSIMRNKSLKK